MANDDDYKVCYRNPPRDHQFKKGQRANPHGRGYKKEPAAGEIFVRIHAEKIATGAGTKPIPRMQVVISRLSAAAAAGDLGAMEMLIDMHTNSEKGGDFQGDGIKRITDKSSSILKVMELEERMLRGASRRRRK